MPSGEKRSRTPPDPSQSSYRHVRRDRRAPEIGGLGRLFCRVTFRLILTSSWCMRSSQPRRCTKASGGDGPVSSGWRMPFQTMWAGPSPKARNSLCLSFLAGIATLFGLLAEAHATSAGNPILTDYRGILIRDNGAIAPIQVQAHYIVNNFSIKTFSGVFQIGFQLIDGAGNPVSNEAFCPSFSVFLPAHGAEAGNKQATITPGALVDGAPYRVSVQLYRQDPGGWTPLGTPNLGDEYRFRLADSGTTTGVVPWLNTMTVTRAYALASSPDSASFQINILGVLGRLDLPDQPQNADTYQVFYDVSLAGANTGPVVLSTTRTTVSVPLANQAADGGAASFTINQTLDLEPTAPLDSSDTYTFTVALSYAGPDGVVTAGPTLALPAQQILYFNGLVQFGPVNAVMTDFADDPTPGVTVADGVMATVDLATATFIQGMPNLSLDGAAGLPVKVLANGTAQVQDGFSVGVNPLATPDIGTVSGISFVREQLTLDSAGGHAYCTVNFPAGFGVAGAPNIRRLAPSFPVGSLLLDGSLAPVGPVTLPPGNIDARSIYASHEELPELFQCDSIIWDVAGGSFTLRRTDTHFVRQAEMDALDALPLGVGTLVAKIRPSNDHLYRYPASNAGSDVVIKADPSGRAVLASARIDLPASSYMAHFPKSVTVGWTQPGVVVITDGLIDPGQSQLPGANDVSVGVRSAGPNLPSVFISDSVTFSPSQATWLVTPDGGLRAEGSVTPTTLRWGTVDGSTYAQAVTSFSDATAHVPGVVLRGRLATTADDQRPGELLLSGHGQPGNPSYVERPGSSLYTVGLADYAGLNFRVTAAAGQTAISEIGDASVGPYPLRAISKYYVRPAGVSGIHAADAAAFKAASSGLVVYGFGLTLNDYQLSFLDNVPHDSLVDGVVQVPGVRGTPGFGQPFTRLMFNSAGQPTVPTLPEPNPVQHLLSYWNVLFHPLSAEFQTKPGAPNAHALIMGGEVLLPGVIQDPLRGALGFFSDGHLVAAADGFPGVDSRFKLPKLVSLHGTRSAVDSTAPGFSVHPVSKLYFNDPNAAGAPNQGFVAFAGAVKVPFFQDLKVHVLARANGASTSVRAGWSDNSGNDFFNQVGFDAANRGFPPGASASDYENAAEPQNFDYYDPDDPAHRARNPYNPLATQSWLGFVKFALPVTWDPTRRRFVSSAPEQQNFLVLNSQRVIQQLTPSGAEIRFGLQFNGLPRINLAALVIDDKEATDQLLKFIPQGPQLVAGVNAFEKLLNNQSDGLISQGLDFVIDQFVDDLFQAGGPLNGVPSAAGAVAAIGPAGSASFQQLEKDLHDRLSGIVGTVTDAVSIMRDIHDALGAVDSGLGAADSMLAKDADGQRGAFITQTIALATSVGLPTEAVAQVTDSATSLINGELAPTLDDIQRSLDEVHSLSNSAEDLVGGVEGIAQAALDDVNQADALTDSVLGAIVEDFKVAHDPTGLLLEEMDPAALRTHLKKIIHDAVLQSGFVTELQSSVRDIVEPLHSEYGAAFDQIFGVLNGVVTSTLQELSDQVIDHLNDSVGQLNRTIGSFSDTLRMSQVEGSATIIGDVLDSAHINGSLALHVPDPISLSGSIDFSHFRADQPVPGCAAGNPDGRMQITLTAKGDASISGAPPVHARAQGQYTMQSDGTPLAVAGSLSVDSDAHFDIVSLKHAEFDFAFGAMDNYVYGEGAGSILIFDVNVRAFMGRTCDTALLNRIDPQILDVFTALGVTPVSPKHAVTGYYYRGDGDVSLNRLFEIPDDVLTLKAKGGQGSFAFCNDDLTQVIPGSHWRFGLSVGLGPLTADAELNALGGLDPIALLRNDSVANIAASMFTQPGLIHGAVAGDFKATASAGPFSTSKDFRFTAHGSYTPPPLAPPPGFFFVNQLDF